jgi:hypothetical protein
LVSRSATGTSTPSAVIVGDATRPLRSQIALAASLVLRSVESFR